MICHKAILSDYRPRKRERLAGASLWKGANFPEESSATSAPAQSIIPAGNLPSHSPPEDALGQCLIF
jgi:hypothetical protein